MSEKDIIKKYETQADTSFVATEDDLKVIQEFASQESKKEAVITKGEFKTNDIKLTPVQFEEKPVITAPTTENDLKTDYQYIRTNLYAITERSVDALNNLVQIADQSQHPRAYEVVALLVNTIANAQKDLMTIHQQKAKIEGTILKNQPEVVNNNLFVGNTAQLDEIISKMTLKKPTDE